MPPLLPRYSSFSAIIAFRRYRRFFISFHAFSLFLLLIITLFDYFTLLSLMLIDAVSLLFAPCCCRITLETFDAAYAIKVYDAITLLYA